MVEYWINVCYLTLVFAAFTQYRRFLLAAYDITYTNYWLAVIEALILAKVIMIGDVVRLGRGLEHKPLIYPTLYKTVVFTLFVGVFTALEHAIKGLWTGTGFMGGIADFFGKGPMNCSPTAWSFSWLLSLSSPSRSWGGCWERKK